ncbi:MAG: AAA family ATPase [Prevotella sp.]|nr:AAA family ATPase [Prevotella sp.]
MKISVSNFGPIKKANIETKQFNIFIGNTSTGKSVVAKLITIFNSQQFTDIPVGDFASFQKLLADYCIDFQFSDTTTINVIQDNIEWNITKNSITRVGEPSTPLDFIKPDGISDFHDFSKEFAKHYADKKEDDVLQNARINMMKVIKEGAIKGEMDFSPMTQFQKDLMYYTIIQYVNIMYSPVYIPAERILISIYSNSIFNLLRSGSTIPQSIKNFGSLYENARNSLSKMEIDFLKMKVTFSKESDTILLNNGTELKFNQASSGIQSLIPLWAVLVNCFSSHPKSVVIEEPELNLFPTLQVHLISNIVKLINNSKSSIVITTHSPYILSIIDNLIYANDIYIKANTLGKKNQRQKVLRLVKKDTLINYEKVAAYCFNDDGTVQLINDPDMRSTGSFAIDEASNETSRLFNKLMSIEDEL